MYQSSAWTIIKITSYDLLNKDSIEIINLRLRNHSEVGYKNTNHHDVIKVTSILVDINGRLVEVIPQITMEVESAQAPKPFVVILNCSVV